MPATLKINVWNGRNFYNHHCPMCSYQGNHTPDQDKADRLFAAHLRTHK